MSCGLINLIFFLEFWCKILLLCGYTILLPILVPNSYSLFLLRIAIMLEVKTLSILSKFGQRQKKKKKKKKKKSFFSGWESTKSVP